MNAAGGRGEGRNVGLGALLALSIASAAPAMAQTPPAGDARHLYAGATYGQAHWSPGCGAVVSCDDTDRTLAVFGGYQINRVLAAEVGYRNMGEASGAGTNTKGHAWEAVGTAGWPIAGAFSVYGKLGVFRSKADAGGRGKETNYGPTYGIGAQFELNPNIAFRAQWQNYSGVGGSTLPKSDISVMDVGALWRFR